MYVGCKNQDTLKALKEKKNKRNDGNESNMEKTEEALPKLVKISAFIIKKHLAHITNFEYLAQFAAKDWHDQILEKYLKNVDNHKIATSK